jgi:hypothetical protein
MDLIKVPIDEIIEYPGNARRGDVQVLVESLQVNGQYRPIVVQESTNYVLAGNHLVRAAKMLGWEEIEAIFIDCDDQAALKIVLADNKTADMGSYNDGLLQALLKDLESFDGTGYSEADIRDLEKIATESAPTEPEIDFAVGIREQNNYVVLVFDDTVDWQNALDTLGIKTVKAWDYKETYKRMGLGRVIAGGPILRRLSNVNN